MRCSKPGCTVDLDPPGVLLRRWTVDDAQWVFANYQSAEFGGLEIRDVNHAAVVVADWADDQTRQAITDESGMLVSSVQLLTGHPELREGELEIVLWVGSTTEGSGFGRAGVQAALDTLVPDDVSAVVAFIKYTYSDVNPRAVAAVIDRGFILDEARHHGGLPVSYDAYVWRNPRHSVEPAVAEPGSAGDSLADAVDACEVRTARPVDP